MPYTASHRFAHGGAQKARLVADLIRGKRLDDAEAILRLSPKRAAAMMVKVLGSARANAQDRGEEEMNRLVVSRVWVDEGPTTRRWRPNSKGRAFTEIRRKCHLNLELSVVSDGE